MAITYRILAAACAVFWCVAAAQAQTPADTMKSDIEAACRTDCRAHCSSVPKGGPEATACLQQNLSVLSAPCRSALAQLPTDAQRSAIRSACRSDYWAYCRSVPTGGAAALSCLQQNRSSLSASCQSAVGAVGRTAAPKPDFTHFSADPNEINVLCEIVGME